MNSINRIKVSFFAACLILIATAVGHAQVPPTNAPRPVAVSDPAPVLDAGQGAGQVQHIFPAGQCTRCAADWYRARTGHVVTWGGNGKDWLNNAAAAGFRTTTASSAIVTNAILVFGPDKYKNGTINPYGHVAIVDKVSRDSVSISECNFAIPGKPSTRTIKFSDLARYKFIGAILP